MHRLSFLRKRIVSGLDDGNATPTPPDELCKDRLGDHEGFDAMLDTVRKQGRQPSDIVGACLGGSQTGNPRTLAGGRHKHLQAPAGETDPEVRGTHVSLGSQQNHADVSPLGKVVSQSLNDMVVGRAFTHCASPVSTGA